MSESVCSTNECKRIARALCHCCNQNICLLHLKEHYDKLFRQLNPLTDETNVIAERLATIDIKTLLQTYHEQLEAWRHTCFKTIDQVFKEKYKEMEEIVQKKIAHETLAIDLVQSTIKKLNEEQEVSQRDIDLIKTEMFLLNENLTNIEHVSFQVNIDPLSIDNNTIQIKEIYSLNMILSSSLKTINLPDLTSSIIISDNRYLLFQQSSYLCLMSDDFKIVKKIPWSFTKIHDICWSPALNRFILTTETCGICFVYEHSISLQDIDCFTREKFQSCTCSNTCLYLTNDSCGSSIMEFCLLPSIELAKQWKSPHTCTKDEYIKFIRYSNETLGLLIENFQEKTLKLELRCVKTLAHIWSIQLHMAAKPYQYGYSVFNDCEWLFIDRTSSNILHISKDGKIKQTCNYNFKLCNVNLYKHNILAILTHNSLIFHRI